MYAPTGFSGSELGDVEVVFHEGVFHLFHLTLPNHDVIAHAVSPDGIRWEPKPPALHTGPHGSFDDDQLWTMSVQRFRERFFMLYTALSRADGGRVQRVGLAVSDDLDHWEKLPGPVSEAAHPYRTDREDAPWVAWRDPKPVILDDGRVHVVLCARDPEAPALRQGAVAHLVSDDMKTWEALPPLFAPRHHYEIECPQLFTIGERLYLTAAVLEERLQRYWVADSIDGPFRTPDQHVLMPPGCYAARVCPAHEEHRVFGFHDPGGARGLRDRVLPSALTLVQASDGSLDCRRAADWDALAGPPEELAPERLEARFGAAGSRRDANAFVAESGMELFACARPADAMIQLEATVEAPLVGVAVELRPGGGGLFIELDRGMREARVVEYGAATEDDHPWFRRRVLAEGTYQPVPRLELEAICAGGEVVLSIGGRVVVSTHHRPSGGSPSIGLFVESGRVVLEDARLRALSL
jgi:beta-fructofuranosidase